MPSVSIRPASISDIETIRQLAHAIWPVAYDGILQPDEIANMLMRIYHPDSLRAEIEQHGHRFWIASHDGRDVAYASGYRDGDAVWVKKIYVMPSCKGLSIGRQLIETIEQAFAPVREVRLLVNPSNNPAMEFYRHIGFVEAGRKQVQMGDFIFEDYIFARPVAQHKAVS